MTIKSLLRLTLLVVVPLGAGCDRFNEEGCARALEVRGGNMIWVTFLTVTPDVAVTVENLRVTYRGEALAAMPGERSDQWIVIGAVPGRTYSFEGTACGRSFSAKAEYLGGCLGPQIEVAVGEVDEANCPSHDTSADVASD